MRVTPHGSGRHSGKEERSHEELSSCADKQKRIQASSQPGPAASTTTPQACSQKRQASHPASHRLRGRERRRGRGERHRARGRGARARLRQRLLPLGTRLAGLRAAEDSRRQHCTVLQRTFSGSGTTVSTAKCFNALSSYWELLSAVHSAAPHILCLRVANHNAECFSARSSSQSCSEHCRVSPRYVALFCSCTYVG